MAFGGLAESPRPCSAGHHAVLPVPAPSTRKVPVTGSPDTAPAPEVGPRDPLDRSAREDFFAWRSWSMETGLTSAQEKFVEHWSPQRVLDDSRSLPQLVQAVQPWTSVHPDDASLDEAMAVLTTLRPR
jgi:hypothetical protein